MDSTYAPQSPDLSGFHNNPQNPSPSKPPLPPAQSSAALHSYALTSANLQHYPTFSSLSQNSRSLAALRAAYHPPRSYGAYDDTLQGPNQGYPTIPSLPPSHDFDNSQQLTSQIYAQPQFLQQESFLGFKNEPVNEYALDVPAYGSALQQQLGYPGAEQDMSGRVKRERAPESNGMQDVKGLGPSHGIEVKTKFPVARIKRIMQADEEVGKVAQVTPVAVSKALELFMISLVTKSADLARNGNSKRVTAQHLKKAIEADEQFDFLNDIISKVVEGPEAGGKRVKDDDDSDDEEEKKPRKSRGRKKKE